MVKTISKKELLNTLDLTLGQLEQLYSDLDTKLNHLEKTIENVMYLKTMVSSVSKEQDVSVKKVSVKKPSVKKAVKPEVKPAVKATPKTAPQSPKAPKSWKKFSLDNLPKSYTFLKVSFKEGSKAQFGRFLHTSLTKEKNIFIDMLDNKNTTIRIPFENIKQVYEYR